MKAMISYVIYVLGSNIITITDRNIFKLYLMPSYNHWLKLYRFSMPKINVFKLSIRLKNNNKI